MSRSFCSRIRSVVAFAALLLLPGLFGPALARPPRQTCYATGSSNAVDRIPKLWTCQGVPRNYQAGVLWLRIPISARERAEGAAIVVQTTRFDRLAVIFAYADNVRKVEQVRSGDFGNHWHSGGQIAFFASRRPAALSAVLVRIDRLASYDLLRIRSVPVQVASQQFELCAALLGGALALLMVGSIYNIGVALAVRRTLFLWHGLWASSVFLWGLIWSQLALTGFPQLAGTLASKICTQLACLAIMFATMSGMSALRDVVRVRVRQIILGLGASVVLIGAVADLPGADLDLIGPVLAAVTLCTLIAIAACLVWGWRQRNAEVRDLTRSWLIPMMVLGATQVVDFNTVLFGGGAQIAVLFASALQTISLSALATRGLGRLRVERDAAVAAESALAELADRDPLTGLLNRRGFVGRCRLAFGQQNRAPFGLLLIDVDEFKAVNDRFGHEVGDTVLVAIAGQLRGLERHLCLAGRLGGEEFVIGVSGLSSFGLQQFADHVRMVVGACDHGEVSRHRRVTVSIGVAEGLGSTPFETLYGAADRALYAAKRAGRDRVVFKPTVLDAQHGQLSLPFAPTA